MNQRDTFLPYSIVDTLRQLSNIYEVRLLGWIIAKAQSVLKLYNKNLSEINMQHAIGATRVTLPLRYILNSPDDKNHRHAFDKVKDLAAKRIEFEKNDVVYHLNVIAFPELHKHGKNSFLTFLIHQEFWHALHEFTKGYRLIDIGCFLRLSTARDAALYVICSQQTEPIEFGIDKLKKTLGATSAGYKKNNNFIDKYIKPAREELDRKTPFSFDFEVKIQGREIYAIVIKPRPSTQFTPDSPPDFIEAIASQRVRLSDEVREYISEKFNMPPLDIERIEGNVLALGDMTQQLNFLGRVYTAARRGTIRNLGGYLVNALKATARD